MADRFFTSFLLRDVQLQQFLNLLFLMILGRLYAHILPDWRQLLLGTLAALTIDMLLQWGTYGRVRRFSFSVLSTVLGIFLMFFALHWWIYLLLIMAALVQKYLLRIDGEHLYNPSNFAVFVGLLFFYGKAGIIAGQLGSGMLLALAVLLAGAAILIRVRRWMIPVAFTFCYIGAQLLLVGQGDPTYLPEDLLVRFSSVSFLVFILFMLTDPRTTPDPLWGQILFGAVVALLASLMDVVYGIRVQHPFLALTLVTPWRLFFSKRLWEERWGGRERGAFLCHVAITFVGVWIIEARPPYYFSVYT